MGLSLNRPAPTKGIAVFPKKIPYEQALQLWRAKREARERGSKRPQGRRKGIAFFPRPSRLRLLLRDFSRLPLYGQLARRLEKVTKAQQIPGGDG